MTDEELIVYCDEHCRTPLAMFHRNHIRRMFELAGDKARLKKFDALGTPEWFSVHLDAMQPLVNAARRKQGEKRAESTRDGRPDEGRHPLLRSEERRP